MVEYEIGATKRRRRGDLAPKPRLWEALGEGEGLTRILTDFYDRVYEDDRLAHFFREVTKDRAIEKQYSFLMEVFTGRRVYFGERPRNAHHWMVISDELFDYREELMESCLRRYGLAEDLIAQWRQVEEVFRKQIVKNAPIPKKIRGVELPLEGYQTVRMTFGYLCDGCGGETHAGEDVFTHVRTGKTYCGACGPNRMEEDARARAAG
jgi:truncated hemoglobin YjbI